MLSRDSDAARILLALSLLVCATCYTGHTMAATSQTVPAVIDAGQWLLPPLPAWKQNTATTSTCRSGTPPRPGSTWCASEINARVQDRSNMYQLNYKGEAAWYEENSNNDRNDYFDNTFSGDFTCCRRSAG